MYEEESYSIDPHWLTICNKEFATAYGLALESDYTAGVEILSSCMRRLEKMARNDRTRMILVHRCHAERACMLALTSNADLTEGIERFANCRKIGFRDLLTESTVSIVFMRFLCRSKRKDLAKTEFVRTKSRLEENINALNSQLVLLNSVANEFDLARP